MADADAMDPFIGCGVLYLAFGEQYRREARRSIATLRKVSPQVPVAVITDSPWQIEPRPDTFVLRLMEESLRCKPRHMYTASPFCRTLCIDTDTVVARDITPLFGLLDHYDFGVRWVARQLGRGNWLTFHPYATSALVLFKKNEAVAELFENWLRDYDHQSRNVQPSERGLPADKCFADAIAMSTVRCIHLPEYVMFDATQPTITYSPPLIYHGRFVEMEMLHEEISGKWNSAEDYHQRLWLPNIRGLLPAGVRRSDPLLATALILRRVYNSGRRALLRFTRGL